MEYTDCDTCFKAFNVLCEQLDTSELVATEDFQYWVFERGYEAAMQRMIETNQTGYPEKSSLQLLKASN